MDQEDDDDIIKKWTKVIVEARQFPDGVSAYCKLHGISIRIYYYWFGILKPKHQEWHDLAKGKATKSTEESAATESETEVKTNSTRRTFSAAKKKRILQEVDNAPHGGIAAFGVVELLEVSECLHLFYASKGTAYSINIYMVELPKQLPDDPEQLKKLIELLASERDDFFERLQILEQRYRDEMRAKYGRRSEALNPDQLSLFIQAALEQGD